MSKSRANLSSLKTRSYFSRKCPATVPSVPGVSPIGTLWRPQPRARGATLRGGCAPVSNGRRRARNRTGIGGLRDARPSRSESGEEGKETTGACRRSSGLEGCGALSEEGGEEGEGTSRPRAGQRPAHELRGRSIAMGLIGPIAIRPRQFDALVGWPRVFEIPVAQVINNYHTTGAPWGGTGRETRGRGRG